MPLSVDAYAALSDEQKKAAVALADYISVCYDRSIKNACPVCLCRKPDHAIACLLDAYRKALAAAGLLSGEKDV